MNFNDMHTLAKRIDTKIKALETKVARPMNIIFHDNSSEGVKVLSLLNDTIQDITKKKNTIKNKIKEENLTLSEMVKDYNSITKFKSEVVTFLNEYENMWSSHCSNYKPYISSGHGDFSNEELEPFNNLSIQDDRQIADQSFNDSFNNITMSN